MVENLSLWSLCRFRNDYYGLEKIMKRNTWKGSYAMYTILNLGRSTEVIHCVDEISKFTKSSFLE